MTATEDAKQKAAATYNAAADFYDHPVNSFWDRYGRRTVARLTLAAGSRVLDVCCGSGASALPAAQAVRPDGHVLGVDLADKLLQLARVKAAASGLSNVTFRAGDMLALGLPPASFDAVICVFGIFFVPDMHRAVRKLWNLMRTGGQLAVTTWGPRSRLPTPRRGRCPHRPRSQYRHRISIPHAMPSRQRGRRMPPWPPGCRSAIRATSRPPRAG